MNRASRILKHSEHLSLGYTEIGMPEWRLKAGKENPSWTAAYRSINGYNWFGQAGAIQAMDKKEVWNHNVFFDYMLRYYNMTNTGLAKPFFALDMYRKHCVNTE